jgi:serine/threonine protein kinase
MTDVDAVMFRIVENEMPIPEECSEPLKDFLQQCFQKEPLMRPNAELLCEHPWLKNNWDALKVGGFLDSMQGVTNRCRLGAPSSG